jgi:hypothetical protein
MSDRTFTLDEAQSLLPVLESLLRAAIAGKELIEDVEAEMQAVNHRIFLNGGTSVDIVPLARRKAERVKAEQRVRDALAEIDSIGVQVKDIDIGLARSKAARFCFAGSWARKASRNGTGRKKVLQAASPSTSASPREREQTNPWLLRERCEMTSGLGAAGVLKQTKFLIPSPAGRANPRKREGFCSCRIPLWL